MSATWDQWQDQTAELMALNAAARCHNIRNDAIATFSAVMDAVALALKISDRRGLAHALCTIAQTTIDLQLAEHSTSLAECAIADVMALKDHELEFRARQVFGVMPGDLRRFDNARRQFDLARDAARMTGNPRLDYRIAANLALLSRKEATHFHKLGETGNFQAARAMAIRHADAALALAGDTKSATLEVGIALVRGEIHALQGDLGAAIRETTAAITLASLAKLMGPILAASIRLAEFHRLSGQPASSVGVLQERQSFRQEHGIARDYLWKLRAQVLPGAA